MKGNFIMHQAYDELKKNKLTLNDFLIIGIEV